MSLSSVACVLIGIGATVSLVAEGQQQPEQNFDFLADGIARARRYNSEACVRLRTEQVYLRLRATTEIGQQRCHSARGHPCRGGPFVNFAGQGFSQAHCASVESSRVAKPILDLLPAKSEDVQFKYVYNQKAGSTSLGLTKALFKGSGKSKVKCYQQFRLETGAAGAAIGKGGEPHVQPRSIAENVVPFTMVAEPLHVFLDGLNTMDCYFLRGNRSWMHKHPGRGSVSAIQEMLSVYTQGVALNHAAKHAWPQAMKIDQALEKRDSAYSGIQYIGLLANVSSYVRAMVPSAGHMAHRIHEDTDKCKEDFWTAVQQLTPEDMRIACKYVEVDYICFDLPIPPACQPFLR